MHKFFIFLYNILCKIGKPIADAEDRMVKSMFIWSDKDESK
jgi:hypothetical protein